MPLNDDRDVSVQRWMVDSSLKDMQFHLDALVRWYKDALSGEEKASITQLKAQIDEIRTKITSGL
jgi:hypothetical protein